MDAELFVGTVMHARTNGPAHRFRYRMFAMLIDIDRIDAAAARLRWFSRNRFNLFSFHDRDHLARGSRSGLREWIEAVLRSRGVELDGGRVRLLCMPRVLGFVFNPISVWYCEHRDGSLRAIVAEVRNTFGERHCYVLHDHGTRLQWAVPLRHDKRLHVSPFIGMRAEYEFRLRRPGERLDYTIVERVDGERLLTATQRLRRIALTDTSLLRLAVVQPFLTLKVVAAIHWQALKILLRGGEFNRKPPPPVDEVS